MFKESSKNRGVFKTQASIYDGAFCEYTYWIYICNKNFIIDVRLGYIKASKNFEISKLKVR